MKLWGWKRASAALIGLLALAFLFELALRVCWGLGDPVLYEPDSEIGYLHRPNQDVRRFGNRIVINRFGQRGEETAERPADGVTRVMALGDSVTFGGVLISRDETYPARLTEALRAKCDKRFEALNASAGSWGIGNEFAYLERFGTLHSELVIWQIGSHDLLQRKSTSENVGADPQMPAEKPLCAVSELIARYVLPRLMPAKIPSETEDESGRLFDRNMVWATRGIELIRKQGSKVCILHTPDRLDVARGPDGALQEKYAPYRKRFVALAGELKVPLLDLVDEWRDRPGIATAFRDSVHLSVEGNRIVGACDMKKP
jgi:lysophospholipase L1-like esterase